MFVHHVHDLLSHLGVDLLHGPRHRSGEIAVGLGLPGLLELAVDLLQRFVDGGDGLHHRGRIHLSQDGAGGDGVAVLHAHGFHGDGGGELQRHGLLLRQGPGGLEEAGQVLLLHRAGQGLDVGHGPAFRFLLFVHRKQEHHQHQGPEQQQEGGPKGHPAQGDGLPLLLLLLADLFIEEHQPQDAQGHAQNGGDQDVQPIGAHLLNEGQQLS